MRVQTVPLKQQERAYSVAPCRNSDEGDKQQPSPLTEAELEQLQLAMRYLAPNMPVWQEEDQITAHNIGECFPRLPINQRSKLLGKQLPASLIRNGHHIIVMRKSDLLGRGGGGLGVYKAQYYHRNATGLKYRPGESLAVKLMSPDPSATQTDAQWECHYTQRYDKSSHTTLIETTEYDYLMMPLAQGVPLSHLLDAYLVTPEQALLIAKNLCVEIKKLHKQNILHGDLKPDNIIVNPETFDVHLIDFGCARDPQKNAAEQRLNGTSIYLDPIEVLLDFRYQKKRYLLKKKNDPAYNESNDLVLQDIQNREDATPFTNDEKKIADLIFNKDKETHLNLEIDVYALGVCFYHLLAPIENAVSVRDPIHDRINPTLSHHQPLKLEAIAKLKEKPPRGYTEFFLTLIPKMTTPNLQKRLTISDVITEINKLQNQLYQPERQVLALLAEKLRPQLTEAADHIPSLVNTFKTDLQQQAGNTHKIALLDALSSAYRDCYTRITERLEDPEPLDEAELLGFFKNTRDLIYQKQFRPLFVNVFSGFKKFLYDLSRIIAYPLGLLTGNTHWQVFGFNTNNFVNHATTIANRITQVYFHSAPENRKTHTRLNDRRSRFSGLLNRHSVMHPFPLMT